MKKEITVDEYCPYCKRHCSLKTPHCGKGKTLAKEIPGLKSGDGRTLDIETAEWKRIYTDIKLLHLYQSGYERLSCKKADKQSDKKIRFYLLAILADKGGLTKKEWKDCSELSSADFAEAIQKLEKKEYISWRQDEIKGKIVFLTDKGLESAKAHIKEGKEERSNIFSILKKEEKEYLEHILKKIVQQ